MIFQNQNLRTSGARCKIWIGLFVLFFFVGATSYASKPFTPSYSKFRLIMSQDDDVCNYAKEQFDMNSKSNKILYANIPAFSEVIWFPHTFNLIRPDDSTVKINVNVSEFDIDNDGKQETVINDTVKLSGYAGNQLFVFDAPPKDLLHNGTVHYEDYIGYKGIKFSTNYPYRLDLDNLKPKYQSNKYTDNNLILLSNIQVMKFEDKFYVVLDQVRKLNYAPRWIIIAEYLNETVVMGDNMERRTNKLRYVCYYDGQ